MNVVQYSVIFKTMVKDDKKNNIVLIKLNDLENTVL